MATEGDVRGRNEGGKRWELERRSVINRKTNHHGGATMVETTVLVVAGKKMSIPRLLKRTLQVAMAVAVTAAVFLVVIVGNGAVAGRGPSSQAARNPWF